jgi:hypothetical protein
LCPQGVARPLQQGPALWVVAQCTPQLQPTHHLAGYGSGMCRRRTFRQHAAHAGEQTTHTLRRLCQLAEAEPLSQSEWLLR